MPAWGRDHTIGDFIHSLFLFGGEPAQGMMTSHEGGHQETTSDEEPKSGFTILGISFILFGGEPVTLIACCVCDTCTHPHLSLLCLTSSSDLALLLFLAITGHLLLLLAIANNLLLLLVRHLPPCRRPPTCRSPRYCCQCQKLT